ICRRTKLSRSSVCAARSTESTKPRAAQGAGRANLAAPFRGTVQRRTRKAGNNRARLVRQRCGVRWQCLRSCYGCCSRCTSIITKGDCLLIAAFATPTGDRVERGEKCSGRGCLLELLLRLRPDLRWGGTPLPASKCSSDCAPPATKLGRTPK